MDGLFLQIQRRLVASLLFDGSAAMRVLELVQPESFSDDKLSLIFNAMGNVSRRDEPISTMTVFRDLELSGGLKLVGGVEELYRLQGEGERYLMEAPILVYASLLREHSAKNRVSEMLNTAMADFTDDSGMSALDGISSLQSLLGDALLTISDEATTSNAASSASDYEKLLEERRRISEQNAEKSDGLQGIPSLLPKLNKATGGWKPGQMITVAARTGVGKSVFAVNAAVAAARAGKSVLFFSMEMSNEEIMDRIIASMSGVPMDRLKTGQLIDQDYTYVNRARADLRDMKIVIDTDPKLTVDVIRSKSFRQAQSENGLDMVIIDYLQLITGASRSKANRSEVVSEISRNMKLTAKVLEVPVMVLAQLNRSNNKDDGDDDTPDLNDIRESAAIAMDSDAVIILHRTKTQDGSTPPTYVILDKNRGGQADITIRCHSDLPCSMFREMSSSSEAMERTSEEDADELVDQFDPSFGSEDSMGDLDDIDSNFFLDDDDLAAIAEF